MTFGVLHGLGAGSCKATFAHTHLSQCSPKALFQVPLPSETGWACPKRRAFSVVAPIARMTAHELSHTGYTDSKHVLDGFHQ